MMEVRIVKEIIVKNTFIMAEHLGECKGKAGKKEKKAITIAPGFCILGFLHRYGKRCCEELSERCKARIKLFCVKMEPGW